MSLAVIGLVGWASGLGFGWLFTLGTANVVRSWMSPPTLLALGTGQVGILLGPRRPHHGDAGPHPRHRCDHHRNSGVLAAAGRVARPAAPRRWPRRRARRDRAAVPGGAALVPAVGDHPAGDLGDATRIPRHHDRAHADRRHLRTDGQRRPVRVVPDRRRDAGEPADRGHPHRDHLSPAAVAPAARRERHPARGVRTGPPAPPATPATKPDAYAESP